MHEDYVSNDSAADKTSYIKFEYFDDNDGIFDKRL